jgi:hypothetical protein
MEATPEGLAAAAATRELLEVKKRQVEDPVQPRASKKARVPIKTCSHEVARPKDDASESKELDESIYGERGVR